MGKGLIRFASIVFLLISVLVLADSLYTNSKNPQFQNILGTYKPSRVGDYVTVVVYESPRDFPHHLKSIHLLAHS